MAVRYRAAVQQGKKVREKMLTNADCTIFEKDSFVPHVFGEIYWNDSRGQTVTKNGIQISDSVLVYIYEDAYLPKAGDIIVKGIVDFDFDSSSHKSASESMKIFREQFPGFAVVKNVNDCRYGSLPHIEVIAR